MDKKERDPRGPRHQQRSLPDSIRPGTHQGNQQGQERHTTRIENSTVASGTVVTVTR